MNTENNPKNFSVKLIHFISRVFGPGLFIKFFWPSHFIILFSKKILFYITGELSARSEIQCKIEGCSAMILEYEPLIRLHESQCPFRSVQCLHLKCQAPQAKSGFFQFFNFSKTKEEDNNNNKQV